MAEARKDPGERPELRSAAPHQGGPLASSGAAPSGNAADKSDSAGAPQTTVTPRQRSGEEPVAKAGVAGASKSRRFHRVMTAGRATATWAKGPAGRVILPGIVVVALVVLAAASGIYLVPRALEAAPAPSATPTFVDGSAEATAAVPGGLPNSAGVLPPGASAPAVGATGLPTVAPTVTGARPADALATWAEQVGTRVGIPVVAVQAYGYAELVTAKQTPSCHLSWTTLAAIGKVESGHGSHEGAVLGVDGVVQPTIYGLPLDGQGGRQLVRDTDRGALDQDQNFDRAIGPMQFIPATWQASAVDADNDGQKNPNDIDDAALTAAAYLCKGGRDLSKPEQWWEAVLTYNDVRQYAQDVFNTANDYGLRSRT